MGVYGDLGMVENAFTDPELVRERLHRQILKTYLTDSSLSPVPLVRLAERHPDTADRVFRLLTGRPRFRWVRRWGSAAAAPQAGLVTATDRCRAPWSSATA